MTEWWKNIWNHWLAFKIIDWSLLLVWNIILYFPYFAFLMLRSLCCYLFSGFLLFSTLSGSYQLFLYIFIFVSSDFFKCSSYAFVFISISVLFSNALFKPNVWSKETVFISCNIQRWNKVQVLCNAPSNSFSSWSV